MCSLGSALPQKGQQIEMLPFAVFGPDVTYVMWLRLQNARQSNLIGVSLVESSVSDEGGPFQPTFAQE